MAPERRRSDPLSHQLAELVDGQNHLRESHHELRNGATIVGLRTERMERELAELTRDVRTALDDSAGSPMGRNLDRVGRENRERLAQLERTVEEHADFILQLRTAIGLLKVLVGTSLAGTVAALAGLSRSLGWW